jgi:hypothetical protein
MARVLFCNACDAATGVLVIETVTICATCRGPVDWKEVGGELTWTKDDRAFLRQMKIGPD